MEKPTTRAGHGCSRPSRFVTATIAGASGDDEVVFLAVSTDVDRTAVREFMDDAEYGFTVLYDEGSATDFHVTGIPIHFVLGPEGRIQYRDTGFPGPDGLRLPTRSHIAIAEP